MADVEKDIVLRVKSETDQATGQFKNLKQELRSIENELNRMAQSGDTGSKAFQQLQRRAGEVKDQLGDTKAAIKALSSDTFKLDAFTQAAQGIAGGFAAAQGAMSLFGSENKAVEEAIKKTQGAMALLQGVTAITNILQKETAFSAFFLGRAQQANTVATEGAAVATKGFSRALIATGIGAIVVAIGTLIAYWDDLSEAIGLTNTELDITKKAVESIGDTFGKERAEVEKLTYEYEQQNTSAKRKQEIIAELQKISPNYFGTLNKEKTSVEELTTAQNKFNTALTKQALLKGYQKQLEDLGNAQAKINTQLETGTAEVGFLTNTWNQFKGAILGGGIGGAAVTNALNTVDATKQANEELAKNQKQIDAVLKLMTETETELNKMGGEAVVEEQKNVKKKVKSKEELAKEAEKIAKEQRDFEDKERKLSLEADKRYLDASLESTRLSLERKLEINEESYLNGVISEKEYFDNINKLNKEQRDFEDKERQLSLEADKQYLDARLESGRFNIEQEKAMLEEAYLNGVISEKEYNDKVTAIEKEASDKRKEIKEKEAQAQSQMIDLIGSGLGELSKLVGENTKAGKAFAIASTIIDTYQAAQKAYLGQLALTTPDAPIRANIAAAIAIAQGLARVKAISGIKIGKNATNSPSSPASGGGSIPSPSTQATQTSGLDSTQLQLDAQGNLMQQRTMRTYVLETDISAKQQRSKRLQQTATLGK